MKQRVPFRRIGVEEFERRRAENALVLDVRNARSFHEGHIDDAVHVSHANVSAVIGVTSRDKPVLIYCYHGNASQEYGQMFSDFGFRDVSSLDGGYEAWVNGVSETQTIGAELANWLIQQGFQAGDVHSHIANNMTPLMCAAHLGDIGIAQMLIAHGAQINARNADGNNALWLACVGRHLEMIDLLVESNIDLDNRNDNGATSLMYAASAGLAGVVGRLLVRGADTTPESLDGFSAIDLASTIECLTLLRRAGQGAPTTSQSNVAEAQLR